MYLYPPLYHQIDDPQEGQILVYDADTQLWVNSAAPEPGGGGGGRTLFLDTAGGAYTSTPITGTLIEDPNTGTITTITGSLTNTTRHVASFTTPAGYLTSNRIDTGFWLLHLYAYGSTSVSYRFDLSYVDADGTSNKTLIVSGAGGETFLTAGQQMTGNSIYVPVTILPDVTKRIVIDLYVTATGNRSFTFEFRDGTVSHVHTTLPTGASASDGLFGVLNMDGDRPETMPRISAAAAGNTASGEVHLSFFTPAENVTISNITMVTSGTAISGATTVRMGLYTVDGSGNVALVAQTASDTTLFNATNTTLPAPSTPRAATRPAMSWWQEPGMRWGSSLLRAPARACTTALRKTLLSLP